MLDVFVGMYCLIRVADVVVCVLVYVCVQLCSYPNKSIIGDYVSVYEHACITRIIHVLGLCAGVFVCNCESMYACIGLRPCLLVHVCLCVL